MAKEEDYIKVIDGAERRFFESEVRKVMPVSGEAEKNSKEQPVIEGYAAKFNSVTTIGWYYKFEEVIEPGAFDDVLNDDVRCLFNHNPNFVLARSKEGKGTLTLSVDEVGFKYTYVTPNRGYANDLADAIETGDVSQSSFAFEVGEEKWTVGDPEKGILDKRTIIKFRKLYDVAPVTYPAYADTEVAKRSLDAFVKSENPNPDVPEGEEFREEEFSNYDAVVQMNKNLL